mgnify:CR=1 FL=1|tara:strand:- start:932 stop:1570 length:639 start_codon:yes stop_codon:yes gene_type:complete
MNFSQRVDYCVRQMGGRKAAAERTGLSGTVLDKYRRGESDPSRERLLAIAEAAGVSVSWLAAGHGQPHEVTRDSTYIPVFDIELGDGDGMWFQRRTELGSISVNKNLLPPTSIFLAGYKMRGASMQPEIPDNAIALVDEEYEAVRAGGIYLYCHEIKDGGDGQLQLRHITRQTSGYLIRAYNRELYPDETLSPETFNKFHLIGKCFGVLKAF